MENYWDGENNLELFKIDHFEQYYLNGKFHRNDGPALIKYLYNGVKGVEIYYYKNIKHRIDGPAEISYFENGDIYSEEYWFNGIKIDPNKLPFELPIDSPEKKFLFNLKYGG